MSSGRTVIALLFASLCLSAVGLHAGSRRATRETWSMSSIRVPAPALPAATPDIGAGLGDQRAPQHAGLEERNGVGGSARHGHRFGCSSRPRTGAAGRPREQWRDVSLASRTPRSTPSSPLRRPIWTTPRPVRGHSARVATTWRSAQGTIAENRVQLTATVASCRPRAPDWRPSSHRFAPGLPSSRPQASTRAGARPATPGWRASRCATVTGTCPPQRPNSLIPRH